MWKIIWRNGMGWERNSFFLTISFLLCCFALCVFLLIYSVILPFLFCLLFYLSSFLYAFLRFSYFTTFIQISVYGNVFCLYYFVVVWVCCNSKLCSLKKVKGKKIYTILTMKFILSQQRSETIGLVSRVFSFNGCYVNPNLSIYTFISRYTSSVLLNWYLRYIISK